MAKHYNRILDHLVDRSLIGENMIETTLSKLQDNGSPIATHHLIDELIHEYDLNRHEIFQEISRLYAFKEIDLKKESIDDNKIEFIRKIFYDYPEETRGQLITKHVLPLRQHETNRSILIFVSSNPIDRDIYPLIRQTKGYTQFEIAYCRMEELLSLMEKVAYQENEFLKQIQESIQSVEIMDDESGGVDEAALDAEINRSMLTNLVEGALVEAVRKGASDIHFLPKEGNRTEIFFRVDGKLQLWHTQEKVKPEAVAAVVKDRSQNIDRFDRSIAQDGFIQRKIDGFHIRFRVSVIPIVSTEFTRRMESIVIRVLDDRKVIVDLEELGLQEPASSHFRTAISQPQGMVILTGPTGSGKSTTLVAALETVRDASKNILTVEEPVEYMIRGVRQLRLSPKMNFDQALRSILRHDPDIVMVGEMRDLKSASIAVSLSNTGHLTFSTLHTNDAPSAVSRLYMLGVEPFLIANAINLIMAQRLVRKLCENCKKPKKDIDMDMVARLGFNEAEISETKFYEAIGCEKCYQGYKGRIAIMEALLFNSEIRRIILDSKDSVDEESIREVAIQKGMMPLRESGKMRIIKGLTTIKEVISATMEI